jgi:hypothetical protein
VTRTLVSPSSAAQAIPAKPAPTITTCGELSTGAGVRSRVILVQAFIRIANGMHCLTVHIRHWTKDAKLLSEACTLAARSARLNIPMARSSHLSDVEASSRMALIHGVSKFDFWTILRFAAP